MPELFGDISNDPKLWVPQKIENTLSLLELIRILVGTHNPNVSVNQVIVFVSFLIASNLKY